MGASETINIPVEPAVRFQDAILEGFQAAIDKEENCDLQVSCSDGSIMLPSIIFASASPILRRLEIDASDVVLVLPDLACQHVLLFVRCLLSPMKGNSRSHRNVLREVSQILGAKVEENMEEYFVAKETRYLEDVKEVMSELREEDKESQNIAGGEKGTVSSLGMANLDNVTDTVLRENFSDQEGRLVCLVCFQSLPAGDFTGFREHVAKHELRQLERVALVLPDIGRGGPGLKKKVTSEAELNVCRSADGGYKCPKCAKIVEDKAGLRKHLVYHTHREKKYMYQCPQCPALSADSSNLKRHIASVHEKHLFCCKLCDFKDYKKKHLEDHIELVHTNESLQKKNTTKEIEFADQENVQVEISNLAEEERDASDMMQFTFQCGECKCEKETLEDLQKHQTEKHLVKLGENLAMKRASLVKQTLSCHLCGMNFKKGTLLNQHKLKVHQVGMETTFGCDQCGIKCANLPGLKAHQRGHVAKRFLCGSCNKSFLVLAHLKDHVEKGSCLLENRKCKICDKVYSDKIRLELHMRMHNNLKPFPCTICDKAFTQKRSLKEHLLTHDTVRHYECRHCEKKFVQKNHLKYHLASQHAETAGNEVRHQCAVCNKVFPFPYQLRKHVAVHGSKSAERQLQCRRCLSWFSSPALLQEHSSKCSDQTEVKL